MMSHKLPALALLAHVLKRRKKEDFFEILLFWFLERVPPNLNSVKVDGLFLNSYPTSVKVGIIYERNSIPKKSIVLR